MAQPLHALRYRIADEPAPSRLSRLAMPPALVLPLAFYAAMQWSPLFLLVPGLNGLLIGGRDRWKGLGMAVLALVLLVAISVGVTLLARSGAVSRTTLGFVAILIDAAPALPLFALTLAQQRTLALRQALARSA